MELSREQAIIAQEHKVKENHKLANKVKNEVHKLLEEREHAILEDLEENKETIKAIQNQKIKAEEAIIRK